VLVVVTEDEVLDVVELVVTEFFEVEEVVEEVVLGEDVLEVIGVLAEELVEEVAVTADCAYDPLPRIVIT
jgi:hypothetical protein